MSSSGLATQPQGVVLHGWGLSLPVYRERQRVLPKAPGFRRGKLREQPAGTESGVGGTLWNPSRAGAEVRQGAAGASL